MEADQKALALSANPVLTIRTIVDKLSAIDREVNYLMNKAKIWKPTRKANETKTEPEKKNNETVSEAKKEETVKTEEEKKAEPVVEEPITFTDGTTEKPSGMMKGL